MWCHLAQMQPVFRSRSATPVGGARSPQVEVLQYNVLTPPYCEFRHPDHYPNAAVSCNAKARFELLTNKLRPFLQRGAIVCLQEVSTRWHAQLRVVLAEANYDTLFHPYGTWKDGYWGCLLAYPRNLYSLRAMEETCIAETRKWPGAPPPSLGARLASAPGVALRIVLAWLLFAVLKLSFGWINIAAPRRADPFGDCSLGADRPSNQRWLRWWLRSGAGLTCTVACVCAWRGFVCSFSF